MKQVFKSCWPKNINLFTSKSRFYLLKCWEHFFELIKLNSDRWVSERLQKEPYWTFKLVQKWGQNSKNEITDAASKINARLFLSGSRRLPSTGRSRRWWSSWRSSRSGSRTTQPSWLRPCPQQPEEENWNKKFGQFSSHIMNIFFRSKKLPGYLCLAHIIQDFRIQTHLPFSKVQTFLYLFCLHPRIWYEWHYRQNGSNFFKIVRFSRKWKHKNQSSKIVLM